MTSEARILVLHDKVFEKWGHQSLEGTIFLKFLVSFVAHVPEEGNVDLVTRLIWSKVPLIGVLH